MCLKKNMIFIALVFMSTVLITGQTDPKFSDDRELFIGVASNSSVMPNIVILADNSNSMRIAIYHPNYMPSYYYDHLNPTDKNSPQVQLNGITTTNDDSDPNNNNDQTPNAIGFFNGYLTDTKSLASDTTFDICGETTVTIYKLHYDYKATYTGKGSNGKRWSITEEVPGSWKDDNIKNQKVYWGCNNTLNSCTISNSTTIVGVYSLNPLKITVNPGATPCANPPCSIYINPHWEQVGTAENTMGLVPVGTCSSAGYNATKHSNVKLHGGTWNVGSTTYNILYEKNYLYWLAFHASATEIAEVKHWAETGAFKDDSSGIPIPAGYYRMKVMQDVLKDVISSLWTKNSKYNFGLYKLSNSGGAEMLNSLQNANSPGVLNSFTGAVDNITPDTGTPLAEALADIWLYFKEGQAGIQEKDYMPITPENLGRCSDKAGSGNPQNSCPIQIECQKSYVIIMTDGQTSGDYFDEDKYANALFRQPVNGVNGVGAWGDKDTNDPITWDAGQPDIADYCANQSCWYNQIYSGTDFLDDVAYYLKNNDLFPTTDFPGMQSIETYAIGFSIDNQLLAETAKNGNGEYYTANDYTSLKDKLSSAITNIMMRNFAFTSYTAPKRVTTAVGEGATFIGYFMPSAEAIWDGHLQSYTIYSQWYADTDGIDGLSTTEKSGTAYEIKTNCQMITKKNCLQFLSMDRIPNWDAADKLTTSRNLYFLNLSSGTPTVSNFTASNVGALQGPFGFNLPADNPDAVYPEDPLFYNKQALSIVNTISDKLNFGDVFHSDIAYVGAPLIGKNYLQGYNPAIYCDVANLDSDPDCYQKFQSDHKNRQKVLYVGTNTGIIHMINAESSNEGGKEIWGFIPDEVLPSLKTIAIDKKFTYTTDGKIMADDIYCHGATTDPWKSILTFGLKDGGQSFYALDVTHVQTTSPAPTFLWKFADAVYSGNSWSKPIIGKIRYSDSSSSYDRWVVIVSAGKAFNNENTADNKGKAIFVLDAANGDVIWMTGYNSVSGAADVTTTPEMEVSKSAYVNPSSHPSGKKHLTKDETFNYCIPSAISAIDRDSDGYLDSIYFGNVAGHLFKVDIANSDPGNWKTYLLYKTDLSTPVASGTITTITPGIPANTYTINVTSGTFEVLDTAGEPKQFNVMGQTSKAMGFITKITESGNDLFYSIQMTSAESFQLNETIAIKPYDPIFLIPTIYKDDCKNYWINFGTGDRLRSRTNSVSGKFVSFRDGTNTPGKLTVNNLVDLAFNSVTNTFSGSTNIKTADKWGWYFNFPDTASGEKLFDPDPVVLPGSDFLPHIYFNTYQYNPSPLSSTSCNAPSAGVMHIYEFAVDYCNTGNVSGDREDGRIAGGGPGGNSEVIIIKETADVGSVSLPDDPNDPNNPNNQNDPNKKGTGLESIQLPYTGGLLFWKEKKR